MSKKITMSSYPITTDLPQPFLELIGKLAAEWARIEHNVDRSLHYLMHLDPTIGRIGASKSRLADRLQIIGDLIAYKGLTLKEFDLDRYRADLNDAKPDRDLIVHGVWMLDKNAGVYYIAKTRGNWPKDFPMAVRRRSAFPEAVPINEPILQSKVERAQELYDRATELFRAVVIADPPDIQITPGQPETVGPPDADDTP